jgi:hypothetical protein
MHRQCQHLLLLASMSALHTSNSLTTSTFPSSAGQCRGVKLIEQDIRITNIVMRGGRRRSVEPSVSLVDAACICYQIILHVSHVAPHSRVMNAGFACNAGGGSSLTTSKA